MQLGEWKALDAVHVGQERLATSQQPPWAEVDLPPNPEQQTDDEGDLTAGHLLLPLNAKGELLGVMVVSTGVEPIPALSGNRDELLRSIASQTAQAIIIVKTTLTTKKPLRA